MPDLISGLDASNMAIKRPIKYAKLVDYIYQNGIFYGKIKKSLFL